MAVWWACGVGGEICATHAGFRLRLYPYGRVVFGVAERLPNLRRTRQCGRAPPVRSFVSSRRSAVSEDRLPVRVLRGPVASVCAVIAEVEW